MTELKTLLKKHDYITIFQKTGDGCIVTYPHPILIDNRPRLIEYFMIQRGNEPGFWVSTTYDEVKTPQNRFIGVPEYAMRLYIVCEIAACNSYIPIDPSLIIFMDEEYREYEDIEDVIKEPSTEEDVSKEAFLYRLIIEARNDGFPQEYEKVAETHKVKEGYTLIRNFYE